MEKLLTEKEVSQLIGRALQTLRNDRFKGKGLPYIKINRQVKYRPTDVEEYITKARITCL